MQDIQEETDTESIKENLTGNNGTIEFKISWLGSKNSTGTDNELIENFGTNNSLAAVAAGGMTELY